MDNLNTVEYLRKIKNSVIENIRRTGAPSVQLTDVPREPLLNGMDSDAEDEAIDLDADTNQDARKSQLTRDRSIARDNEFEDSDDDDPELNSATRQALARKSRITDYVNPFADKDGPDDDDFVMSGANGGAGLDAAAKDVDDAEDDEAASAESSPRPSRLALAKPQLWSAATEMAHDEPDDEGEEMDVDEEDEEAEEEERTRRDTEADDENIADDEELEMGDDEELQAEVDERDLPEPAERPISTTVATHEEDVDMDEDEDEETAPAKTDVATSGATSVEHTTEIRDKSEEEA